MEPTEDHSSWTSGSQHFGSDDAIDPVDQWVFDPALGEYRLRLPGEAPQQARPAEPAPHSADAPSATGEPARQTRAAARGPQGRARRAAPSRQHNSAGSYGPWVVGVLSLMAVVGGGSYVVLHDGGTASAARPLASATATCAASPPPQSSSAVLIGPKAQPIDVRVTVLNGSSTFGEAEVVLRWMQNTEKFLRTSNGGPAAHTAATSLVYAPNHVDQARTLAAAMHLPASALHGTSKGTGLRDPMVLTLGDDFKGPGLPLATPSAAAPGAGSGCASPASSSPP